MNTPLVSIIIPTFNRAHLIAETLDSILAQTYTNWECIIVDDGSSDATAEVVNKYVNIDSRFQYHHRPNTYKSGGNGARNYGFELSKGEYINWFDSDDIMHPKKLDKQVKSLLYSDFNFAVCQTLVFEDNLKNLLGLRHEKIISNNALFDFVTHKLAFLTQAPIFKRGFLIQNDLKFDEELKAAQEWEFLCRVLFFSPNYLTDDTPLVHLRKHSDNISYGMDKAEREWNYYIAREKVFTLLKNKAFSSKNDVMHYLKEYALKCFKKYLFQRDIIKSFRIFFRVIIYRSSFISSFKIVFFMLFILITGKGYKYRNSKFIFN